MKSQILWQSTLALTAVVVCAGCGQVTATRQLEGAWHIISQEGQGEHLNPFVKQYIVMSPPITKGADLAAVFGTHPDFIAVYDVTLDSSAMPSRIDLVDERGVKWEGIYEVKGDTLRLCMATFRVVRTFGIKSREQVGERPTAFDSTRFYLVTTKRMKEEFY